MALLQQTRNVILKGFLSPCFIRRDRVSSPHANHSRVRRLDTTLIFIGSGCLVCLMPLAVYCLYLSHLNGKSTPTLISGSWDFGALLLGLSGFILLSGPLFITLVNSTWRGYAYGGWANLRSIGRGEALVGTIMATGYFLILLGVIPLLIRSRKRVTAIYNVGAASVEPALIGVLDHLGYTWKRDRGLLLIGAKKPTHLSDVPFEFQHETATVRIDPFPATGHATLKWGDDWRGVRPEVESLLPRMLVSHSSEKSVVASWTFTAALAIMIVMLLWLVVLIYLVMTPGPR